MSGEPDLMADFQRAFERLQAMAQTDPHIAARVPDAAVTAAIQAPGLAYGQVIAATLAGYADRPALGSRAYAIRDGARTYLPAFTTISYRALAGQAEAIANAWRHDPRHRVSPGEFVAYIAFTGAEMTAIDFASVYAQAISVPLQANLPEADMLEIMDDVAPAALVASIDHLDIAVAYALRQESIRSLIVIDADDAVDAERSRIEAARARLRAAGDRIALVGFAELVRIGSAHTWSPRLPKDAMRCRC